jgi:hypothetical protein
VSDGTVNVPRVDHDDTRVTALRDHLTQRCADLLGRMVESDGELFPYRGAEIKRLRKRLDDLKNGRDVLTYRHEIPVELQPPREDGQHVYTLKIPQGTAIVLDTNLSCQAWTRLGMEVMANQYTTYAFEQNAWQFRAEERVTVGVIRPTAICTMTGINPGGS